MSAEIQFAVLLIGGRSGVGKSTVGYEVSAQLQAAEVAHCLIEGDNLDQAFPAPPGDPYRTRLTERNLAAIWRNYRELGYRRLIYTNTVSVLEPDMICRAMSGAPRVTAVLLTAVLLTADDDAIRERLGAREIGTQLDLHLRRSATMAGRLDRTAPASVHRIGTTGRAVPDIAREIIAVTGW